MDKPLQEYCLYNRDGRCYFIVSSPGECSLCFNFITSSEEVRSRFSIKTKIVRLHDIISKNPTYRALFAGAGDEIQQTLKLEF